VKIVSDKVIGHSWLQVSVETSDQWHTSGFGTWPGAVLNIH